MAEASTDLRLQLPRRKLTDPGGHPGLLAELPTDVAALCQVVQRHCLSTIYFGLKLYGPPPANYPSTSRENLTNR